VGHVDAAMNEIAYARLAWGDSPALLATEAFIHNRRGELRRAINVMKRAYPQYLTADGDRLPRAILEVLFPLQYWDRIQVHARAKGLDPFVVAALIGQESTFDPTARSPANAYGLMQLVPTTARRFARSAGVQYSRRGLTDPETNIRLGTTYLARLVEQFGDVHLALASYNAGDSRVRRWLPDRGDLDADEFIDDLPFPETQNYVKRVLGTAENYRRLYGDPPLTASTSIP
jgi:soluble lytic murein transglycosylase